MQKHGENPVEPAVCVTFDVDIIRLLQQVRKQKYYFTLAFVYVVCKCTNEIEALRYRFLDGKIVLFDKIDTAFTYLNKDTELFKVVNVPMQETMEEYPARRIMQHLCLIGENITKRMGRLLCQYQFRHTILLWMVYILENLLVNCRNIWMR